MTDIFTDNEDKDYLAELTGPGGKFDRSRYKDEAEMYKAIAKSKVEADRFIEGKNAQFDQLREDYLKTREELLAKANLEEYQTRMTQNTNTTNTQVDTKPQLDEAKITELAKKEALSALQQLELQRKQESNFATVETKLRERYGEKAREVLRERMNALNLTTEDAKFLAAKSPEALINALNLNSAPPSYDALPRGSSNPDSFRPTATIRDAIYYEDLRREKPKEYFSEKVSVQRIKDMDHPDFLKRFYERQNSRAGGY